MALCSKGYPVVNCRTCASTITCSGCNYYYCLASPTACWPCNAVICELYWLPDLQQLFGVCTLLCVLKLENVSYAHQLYRDVRLATLWQRFFHFKIIIRYIFFFQLFLLSRCRIYRLLIRINQFFEQVNRFPQWAIFERWCNSIKWGKKCWTNSGWGEFYIICDQFEA